MFEKPVAWIKKHKKAVIVTATIIAVTGTVATLVICGKKYDISINELVKRIIPDKLGKAKVSRALDNSASKTNNITEAVSKTVINKVADTASNVTISNIPEVGAAPLDPVLDYNTISRAEHIRRLHTGHHASQGKIAEALARGIPLQEGETLVNGCTVKLRMPKSELIQ